MNQADQRFSPIYRFHSFPFFEPNALLFQPILFSSNLILSSRSLLTVVFSWISTPQGNGKISFKFLDCFPFNHLIFAKVIELFPSVGLHYPFGNLSEP